ncbi:hypothetical protein D3C77_484600 [compost metagenome]
MAGYFAELYLRYNRQSQRCGLSPSRRLSQLPGQSDDMGHGQPPGLPVDPADVSLQRLVLPMDCYRPGRNPRFSASRGPTKNPHSDSRASGYSLVRRPHRTQCPDQHARVCQGGDRSPSQCHGCRCGSAGQGYWCGGRNGHQGDPRLRPHRSLWPRHGLCLARRMGRASAGGTRTDQIPPGCALPDP